MYKKSRNKKFLKLFVGLSSCHIISTSFVPLFLFIEQNNFFAWMYFALGIRNQFGPIWKKIRNFFINKHQILFQFSVSPIAAQSCKQSKRIWIDSLYRVLQSNENHSKKPWRLKVILFIQSWYLSSYWYWHTKKINVWSYYRILHYLLC